MYAAFYRNLNLGHSGSPNREQLETALLSAGASRVKSFQTNGTVLVDSEDPNSVVSTAAQQLREVSGYEEATFVYSLNDLERFLALGIFEKYVSPRTYRETMTFFRGPRVPSWSLPWTNRKDDVDILFVAEGVALGLIRKPRSTAGSPTLEIEREIGGVATTRTRGSIEHLLKMASTWS